MEVKDMTIEELEARKTEILTEMNNEGVDLVALKEESRAIREEIEARKAAEAQKAEIRKAVADGAGTVIQEFKEEKREMSKTNEEIRASKEYVDAFARYLINEDDDVSEIKLS